MSLTVIEKLSVPSELSSLSIVESLIDRVCGSLGVHDDAYGNILIAVTEAVNNAVIHGNQYNAKIDIDVEVLDVNDRLCFSIKDKGNGFDFDNLPDPTAPENIEKENGRGIFLIKNLADELVFDDGGRVVNIFFDRA
ncbi:MAG: ATP-binding protein [Crocinitomicaceae bacterium]|jgi:serine/threonine-protein kinase RsbW|nr:ATP-binding protein [Crocinitomicaceae bacterium]